MRRLGVDRLTGIVRNGAVGRFFSTLAPTMLALGLQFVTFAISARGLGVDQFGAYAAITAIAAVATEVVGLGSADVLVRSVARNPDSFARQFGSVILLVSATLPVVAGVSLWLAVVFVHSSLTLPAILAGLMGEILAARASASAEAVMVAHGHVVKAAGVRVITVVTRLVAALAYFHFAHDLGGWVLAVLAQSAVLAVGLVGVVAWTYGRPHFALDRSDFTQGLSFSIGQASRALQGNIDRVILAAFATTAVVGAYAAGSRLLVVGLFPLQVMTRLLYPDFFRHGEGGIAATRRFAFSKVWVMFAVGLGSFAAVAIVAQVLPRALGHDFIASRHAAVALAAALPLIGLQYLAADSLTGAGFQGLRATLAIVSSGCFGLLMVAGAMLGGVNGVIIAFITAHGLFLALLVLASYLVERRSRAVGAA